MSGLSAAQLIQRTAMIGASEIAAIVGVDPHKTALDVYAAKVHPGHERAAPTRAQRRGLRMEAYVADFYAEETGHEVVADQTTRVHPVHAVVGATPDYFTLGGKRLVEIKTVHPKWMELWGESGTDEVPQHVACQVVQQMAVCDVEEADVAALIGMDDLRIYTIRRNREIEAALLYAAVDFWTRHVEARVPPDVTSLEARERFVYRLFPKSLSDSIRPANSEEAEAIRLLAEARSMASEADSAVTALEVRLKEAIGEGGGIGSVHGTVTWKSAKSGGPDWKAIAESLGAGPEIIAKHQRPGARRFLYSAPKLAKLKGAA